MARYTKAACKLCRREGEKLFLKGSKCGTGKCPVSKRAYAPGQHGKRRSKESNYGLQLREKQKVKRIYGLLERQFRHYFKIAERSKGVTGEVLLQLLERRLDNVIFRCLFAHSRKNARQVVRHGLVKVNNRKVNIPSFSVSVGNEIQIADKRNSQKKAREIFETLKTSGVPKWLEVDPQALKAKVKDLPTKADIGFPIQEQLIVELYSK